MSLLDHLNKGRQEMLVDLYPSQEHLFIQALIVIMKQDWSVVHRRKPQHWNTNL